MNFPTDLFGKKKLRTEFPWWSRGLKSLLTFSVTISFLWMIESCPPKFYVVLLALCSSYRSKACPPLVDGLRHFFKVMLRKKDRDKRSIWAGFSVDRALAIFIF